jgi:hypothetical protein
MWGYKVDDEFQLLSGLYFVDLIWTPYEHAHEIFVTFEIEKDGRRAIKNLEKLFGTSAESVEKPYQHYTIIHDCKLTKGNKQIIQQRATQYNIHLFENVKNDSIEKKRLDDELKQLRIEIPEIIKRKGKMSDIL